MHGVPYAAKDIFDVEGMPTTCHSKVRQHHRATSDAFVIRKLRDAGAILLGKLALHEFATGGPAFDLPWPPARNPWNRDLHPGGSSSGSGVALVCGMAPMTLGTDTGGSVRNPATCCGIVGMKPTYGAVSLSGVFPLTYLARPRRADDAHASRTTPSLLPRHRRPRPGRSDQRHAAAGDCLKDLKAGAERPAHRRDRAFLHRGRGRPIPSRSRGIDAAIDVLRRLGARCGRSACRRCRCGPTATARSTRPSPTRSTNATCRSGRRTSPRITLDKTLAGAFVPASKYIKAQQLRARAVPEFAEAMRDLDAVITLSSL